VSKGNDRWCQLSNLKNFSVFFLQSVANAGAATPGKNAHPVASIEALTGRNFLDHRDGSTLIQSNGDFDSVTGIQCLLGAGTHGTAEKCTADGPGGIRGAALADIAAQQTTCEAAYQRAPGIATLDLDRADGSDSAGLHILCLARFGTGDNISGEAVLGAGGKQDGRSKSEDGNEFHGKKTVGLRLKIPINPLWASNIFGVGSVTFYQFH